MNKLLFLGAVAPMAMQAAERPNIIYIVTDQQAACAMSCVGNSDLHTPNMDRLAAAGVLFQNAYCSAPVSGPSRGAMFTGNTAHEIGLEKNGTPMPDSIRPTSLGILMRDAGYECAYAGKWHVHTASIPDQEFGFTCLHPHNDYGLAEACVKFLDQKHDKPFFLVAGFDNPHNVCEYARQQNLPFAKLKETDTKNCPGLPANYSRNPYDADVVKHEKDYNFKAYPTTYYTADDWRQYRNAYFRLVETVDAEIGKIVDAIDRKNLWKNTVIIFTSDHGDGMGAHQWNQKSALYEEVVNIPMIVTLPGKKNAGKELPQLVSNGVDFYASVLDWAGVELPAGKHGVSYKNLVTKADAAAAHQDYIVTETYFDNGNNTRGWMVRTAKYKYVMYDKGRYREQLFDMDADRGEMRNLVMEKRYEEVLLQHRAMLNEWMKLHNTKQIRVGLNLIPGY